MSSDLREPPAKKRKSRFGPQPTQATPFSTNLSVADDLQRRQQQALAVAASLSKQLGLSDSVPDPNNIAPPNTNTFLQTASLFSGQSYRAHHQRLGFGKPFEERVYIPKDDYPNINFIGLILGPKGLNQKRMQTETGCRILVKGKGSSKNGIPDNDPQEPLHVYISADTQEKVAGGVKKINDLIRESTDKYDEGGMEVKEHRHNGYIDVEIPNSQIGVVIGKQGNNIQRIQDITGATVMISPRNVPNNPLMKMITISGSGIQCEQALTEIYKTIEELKAFRAKLKRQQQQAHTHNKYDHNRQNMNSNNTTMHTHTHAHAPPAHTHTHTQMGENNMNNMDLLDGNNNHRDYGTASYDPSFAYPDAMYDDDLLPKISSGAVESGFCEIIIPNSVVGLIIGKNASNVKAMKDRTRCDIRVQKDEETLPQADTRLVALRGCVQSIKAARQEIAKVIHMANAQKQGATITSMQQQNYQQIMSYQQIMYQQQQQQMMYQQQMGYSHPYSQQYPQQMYTSQQQQQQHAGVDNNPQQMQMQAGGYYQPQWQQTQQAPPPPPPPPLPAPNDKQAENNNNNNNNNTQHDDKSKENEAVAHAISPPNTNKTEEKTDETAGKDVGNVGSVGSVDVDSSQTAQQKQYAQMLESYGWTPQQIAAYRQYPQYYQQYYQQYAQQYPQYAQQYQAAMQQQMQAQQAPPPPPPPPPENNDNKDANDSDVNKDDSSGQTQSTVMESNENNNETQ